MIEELDASVGEILAALDRTGLAANTLVIFTSDNGGVLDDGYQDGSATDPSGHRPNGALRGFKGGLFEGGHRVPFIARWPGHVPVGQSDQLVCHVDLAATCAALLDEKLPDDAAVDSFNILPALMGDKRPVREHLVHHTGGFPGGLAIRTASWKLIEGAPATAGQPERKPMLFKLADDLAEERDLAAAEPGACGRAGRAFGHDSQKPRQPTRGTITGSPPDDHLMMSATPPQHQCDLRLDASRTLCLTFSLSSTVTVSPS